MNHSERPHMKCILTRTHTKIGHNEADYDFSIYKLCKESWVHIFISHNHMEI